MGDGRVSGLTQDIINKVNEISEIPNYIFTVRKPFFSLTRRLKILIPFIEEIRDNTYHVRGNLYYALSSLLNNLETARKLLQRGSKGSKIYLVLEKKQIMREYEAVSAQLGKDLTNIFHENLEIPYEVKEYAAVVLSQFDRAKGIVDQPDDLYEDLFILYDKGTDGVVDPLVLRGLIETLELTDEIDIKKEYGALNELVSNHAGDPLKCIEKMLRILKLIEDFVQGGNQSLDSSLRKSTLVDLCARQGTIETNHDNNAIPNEFLCPISLQLMQDPVVIASGQTYERSSIEKWMEAGNGTCPNTRQMLANRTLIPNFALRNLIDQWSETNGMNPRKRVIPTTSSCTRMESYLIYRYIQQLKSNDLYHPRIGAGEISLLSRRNSEVRVAIAEAGAIPILSQLLKRTRDPLTQEYVLIALLNLSICEENKERIVSNGAIPSIIKVMKRGSVEACEHGAAILFSLAVKDNWKYLIGWCGGIKPLVWLLGKGTERGRKDAATALYTLCLYPFNKVWAVKAGIVMELMNHVREPQGRMKDEALVLLDLIKNHHNATQALDAEDPVVHLVNIIWTGSHMNQEHAASILLHLCSRDSKHVEHAIQLGAESYLADLNHYGSEGGKLTAIKLMEMMTAHRQRKRALTEPSAGSGSRSKRAQKMTNI